MAVVPQEMPELGYILAGLLPIRKLAQSLGKRVAAIFDAACRLGTNLRPW
jgi:hypothetical protein